jgi:hypothetical protein
MFRRRFEWLLLPIAFFVSARLVLWLYTWRERSAWIASHGGDSAAAAYGEGKMDVIMITYTKWPLIIAGICVLVGYGPRVRVSLLFGAISGALAMGLSFLLRETGPFHLPSILVVAILVISHYGYLWRKSGLPAA